MVRGAVVLAAATILLLFSMAIPWQPLFQLAICLYVLAGLCLLWIANSLWRLSFDRPAPVRRGQVGQSVHDAFEVRNGSALPKLGLEIRDHSTLPGHRASSVVNLAPRRREDGFADTVSEMRGRYTLGPTGAAATDPFGLFTLERRVGGASELLVYPETVDLGPFSLPGTIVSDGTRMRRRTQQQTVDPAGTRPYVNGDSVRRIHWLSSAHAGQLMVKEFEFSPVADVWIFLDLERSVQAGAGLQSTEEYAVTAAASLAAHYLKAGRAVGLVATGRRREIVPSDRGQRHVVRLLEALALVKTDGRDPLHQALGAERSRLHRSTTAVVISPSVDERWAGLLAQIQHAGTPTAALLVEAATFGPAPATTMQVAALAAAGTPTYLLKRSATIPEALRQALVAPSLGRG